ncbi:MAG TPA: DNA-3-methyladenine glycosylase [Tepidisphaeraceae bacterium]|nr:DNA-3-methyladenine glycosylase [Tepidisphaeraceae bacterium]
MWSSKSKPTSWIEAEEFLKRDRVLKKLIERVGPCTLAPNKDVFATLVKSILSQQVSTAAANSMHRKLCERLPRKKISPQNVLDFLTTNDEETIRSCGLSRQKRGYIQDLSGKFLDGTVPYKHFSKLDDEQLIESLTEVKGIGRWTAEMLLIFALNRPDVWPVDDLGIRESVFKHWPKKFTERPKPKEVLDFADKWKPWRSVASWYLWAGVD